MATVALLMAGGRGERMRASGIDLPKPLVPVAGVALVERNLQRLLRQRFDDVVVAVPAGGAVAAYAEDRLAGIAAAAGARLRVLAEPRPLGNIGCAGMLHGEDDVLVVYADNLTTLDLRDVVRYHGRSGAALTLAAHDEPFTIPYGRLEIRDGRVVGYAEKPTLAVTVATAVAVLGPAATAALPADRPTGLVDLTRTLLERGELVSAFRHAEPWVDVNDAEGVRRAERLLASHGGEFEPPPRP